MKKILLGVLAVTSLSATAQNCSKVFISKYMRGKGNTKCIELYNPTNAPIDITGYTVSRYKNSGGTVSTYVPGAFPSTSTGDTAILAGTIPAYGTFLLVNGQITPNTSTSPACHPGLQAKANQLDKPYGTYGASQGQPMYFKGSDALVLKDAAGTIADIFGETGVAVNSAWSTTAPYRGQTGQGAWITNKYLMVRRPTVMAGILAMPTEFNPMAEYDTIPGMPTGSTSADSLLLFDIFGTHDCDCKNLTSVKSINNDVVSIAPNPASNFITLTANAGIVNVTVFNVIGKQVKNVTTNAANKVTVDVANLEKGMYIVNVRTANNNTVAHKIIVE
ncbi:MAG: lamin tail domain-containing protein [Bacteroidia bacterium]|jgi:hypothetical protein